MSLEARSVRTGRPRYVWRLLSATTLDSICPTPSSSHCYKNQFTESLLRFTWVHPDITLLWLILELCSCHEVCPLLHGYSGHSCRRTRKVGRLMPMNLSLTNEARIWCTKAFSFVPWMDSSEAYFICLLLKSHWIKLQLPTVGNEVILVVASSLLSSTFCLSCVLLTNFCSRLSFGKPKTKTSFITKKKLLKCQDTKSAQKGL